MYRNRDLALAVLGTVGQRCRCASAMLPVRTIAVPKLASDGNTIVDLVASIRLFTTSLVNSSGECAL